jgi:hypothetical protein
VALLVLPPLVPGPLLVRPGGRLPLALALPLWFPVGRSRSLFRPRGWLPLALARLLWWLVCPRPLTTPRTPRA